MIVNNVENIWSPNEKKKKRIYNQNLNHREQKTRLDFLLITLSFSQWYFLLGMNQAFILLQVINFTCW